MGGTGSPPTGTSTPRPRTPPTLSPCSSQLCPACPARTTPSTPRFPRPPSGARVRWTEVTTPTPRPSARSSTSAPLTELAASPSTASSAPTELSSTRTPSSATGGSTSTAPPPRPSTASMMSTLPRETPWALLATRSLPTPPHLLKLPMLVTLPPPSTKVLDVELDVRDLPGGRAGGRVASKHHHHPSHQHLKTLYF